MFDQDLYHKNIIKRRFEAIGNVRRAENIFDRESLSILTNSTAD